jgi:hypothetical protein
MYGRVHVRVMRGAVNVLGFILTPTTTLKGNATRWWSVYSPFNQSAIVFKAIDSSHEQQQQQQQQQQQLLAPHCQDEYVSTLDTAKSEEEQHLMDALAESDLTAHTVLALRAFGEIRSDEYRIVTAEGTSIAALFASPHRRHHRHVASHTAGLSTVLRLPQLHVVCISLSLCPSLGLCVFVFM